MSEERWLPILGFPGYDVSDAGEVGSYQPRNGRGPLSKTRRVLKTWISKGGYVLIHFCRDGRRYHRRVHRLVLETFVGPCPPGKQASHRDGNKLNNTLLNLLWETPGDNNRRKKYCWRQTETQTIGASGYRGVTPHRKRWQVRIRHLGRYIYINMFDTAREAALAYDAKLLEMYGAGTVTNRSLGLL